MDRKFGKYIFGGLVIGEALGLLWGTAIGNLAVGIALGTLGGVFAGWFAGAIALRKATEEKREE